MQPQCLEIANSTRHADILLRTVTAISALQKAGEKVSFYAVADKAQVSRSTLYRCPDLRGLVEAARVETASTDQSPIKVLDDRVAELEEFLAQAVRERDALKQAIDAISPVRYAFVQVVEAA